MSQERTEQPTQKRLRDSREKGQIARSRDLALAAASVASTMGLAYLGGRLVGGLEDLLRHGLATFGDDPLRIVTAGELNGVVLVGLQRLAVLVGPLALVTTVAAVGMHGFQGGWSFTPGALHLNWSRLNPASGMQRFGFTQSGVETLKAIAAFTAIGYFTWGTIYSLMHEAPRLPWMAPVDAATVTWHSAEQLLWRSAWVLAVLALADYGVQRYRHTSSLKMTKQEVKDEHKMMEGSGEVKGKIRMLQRQLARRNMLRDVERATVVITNPTHYAIALEYRRDTMVAPRVLAKGADHLAKKIRERAIKHGIPLVENKPLAQSLYATAEVGQVIPAPLFAAVAEVLAYLIRVKRLML